MAGQEDLREIMSEVRTDVRWIKESLKRGTERLDKHDKRLGSLERWRTWTAGIGATLAGLIGIGQLPKM